MAAGFHRVTSSNANTNLEPQYRIGTNLEVFTGGEAVYLLAGVVTKGVTNTAILGYVEQRDPITGDGVTANIPVIEDSGAIWEADYGAIIAADRQPGDLLDLNAAATGLAANVNGDFIVTNRDILPKVGKVWVKRTDPQLPA